MSPRHSSLPATGALRFLIIQSTAWDWEAGMFQDLTDTQHPDPVCIAAWVQRIPIWENGTTISLGSGRHIHSLLAGVGWWERHPPRHILHCGWSECQRPQIGNSCRWGTAGGCSAQQRNYSGGRSGELYPFPITL